MLYIYSIETDSISSTRAFKNSSRKLTIFQRLSCDLRSGNVYVVCFFPQAVLDIMEWKLHPKMVPEILDAVAGILILNI